MRYIDADELLELYDINDLEKDVDWKVPIEVVKQNIKDMPSADVVEVGCITCFGIKFVVEDDIIKVKWRHGDKHYIVPFGELLKLWEKYIENVKEVK